MNVVSFEHAYTAACGGGVTRAVLSVCRATCVAMLTSTFCEALQAWAGWGVGALGTGANGSGVCESRVIV